MRHDRDRLAEIAAALAASLGEPCQSAITGRRTISVLMSDGDWALWLSDNIVRWQVTIREQPPGLGTWWSSGDFVFGAEGCSVAKLAARITETMDDLRTVVRDGLRRPVVLELPRGRRPILTMID